MEEVWQSEFQEPNTQPSSEFQAVWDLSQCIQVALDNQPAIEVNEASLGSASQKEKIAKSYFFPQVRFDATYTYLDKPQTASITNIFSDPVTDVFSSGAAFFGIANQAGSSAALAALDNPNVPLGAGLPSFNQVKEAAASQLPQTSTTGLLGRNSLSTQLLAVQPIWTGGKILYRHQQSQLGIHAASADVEKSRQDTTFQVTQAYRGIQFAESVLRVNQDATGRFRAIEALVQSLLNAGDEYVTTAELHRVASVRLQSENQEIKIRSARQLAYAALKQAMGMDPAYELDIAEKELPQADYGLDREGLLSQALVMRPEIAKAHLGIENSHLEQKLARAEYSPDVSLFGRFTTIEDDENFPNPNDSQRRLWGTGVTVGVPLFTGGRRRAARHDAEFQQAKSMHTLQLATDLITLEVEKTFLEYQEASQQLATTKQALEAAEKAAESYRLQFSGGLIREEDMPDYFEDLVETRLLVVGTQVQNLETLYRMNIALAKLELVTSADLSLLKMGNAKVSTDQWE